MQVTAEKNLSKNPVCTYCGKRRGLFEHFNKYGFCESCYETTKKTITNSITALSELCSKLPDKTAILLPHAPESNKALLNTVESGFSLLQRLNEMKKKVPAFKSDLSEYELKLTGIKDFIAFRENRNAKISAQINVLTPAEVPAPSQAPEVVEPSALVEDSMLKTDTLISVPKDFPKRLILSGLRLLYHYDDVLLFVPEEIQIVSNGWKGGELLRFEFESPDKKAERAVAFYLDKQKIGYLFPGTLQNMIFDFVKRQEIVISRLFFYSRESGELKIFLGFYGKTRFQKLQEQGEPFKSYRLIHTLHYAYFYDLLEGDELDLDYDEESKKYKVLWDCGEIGFLPKNATQSLNKAGHSIEAYIQSVELDEKDKLFIQVAVFFR